MEIDAVLTLLRDPAVRLLTLTGPGGVGKTRLALEVAAVAGLDVTGGEPLLVPLAAVADPALVLPAVARMLALAEDDATPIERRLADAVAGRPRLLILDNLEQIVAAGPPIASLVAACPELTILVTSRSRLNVRGEHELPVPPLTLPVVSEAGGEGERGADVARLAASDAVALFVQRGRAANPDFALNAANAPTVAELCRRLDGLPLAIELAAARTRVVSPEAMLARLTGRLSLLGAGPMDSPERHRSLERAFAWSHDLLGEGERRLFRRMAVFLGSFGLDFAEAVGVEPGGDPAPVVDGLTTLLDANLLVRAPSETGEIRFRMLETVREYARMQLADAGEVDAVTARHAEWCRDQVVAAELVIHGSEQGRWFANFAEEHDNLRAAIDWALGAGRVDLALRLIVGPLWFFWAMRGWVRQERHRLDRVLALIDAAPDSAPPALVAKARFDDALYYLQTGNNAAARGGFEWVLAHLRQTGDVGRNPVAGVLGNLAAIDLDQGDYASARARLVEALAIRRELGDPGAIARTLVNLAGAANHQGDHGAAVELMDEGLALARGAGDRRTMAYCLLNLGESAAGQGHDLRAVAFFDQALGLLRYAGDVNGEGTALVNLASAALRLGDTRRASAALVETLKQQRDLHTPVVVADALEVAAEVALAVTRPSLAPRLLVSARAVRSSAAAVATPLAQRRLSRATSVALLALGRAAFDEGEIAGRALTGADAVDQAIAFLTDTAGGAGRLTALPRPEPSSARPDGQLPVVAATAPALPMGGEFSRRQGEVLRLLCDGLTDPEIAERLGVGTRTVESHVSAILNKLGVHARTAAVAYALRSGIA